MDRWWKWLYPVTCSYAFIQLCMDPKFSQNDDRMWNISCNTHYATQDYYKYFTDSIEIMGEKKGPKPTKGCGAAADDDY